VVDKDRKKYKQLGVDSFFYNPTEKVHYILYWDGSLYNHHSLSSCTFMNYRDDGLLVKYILKYSIYTKVEFIDEMETTSLVSSLIVDRPEEQEINDHSNDNLKNVYSIDRNIPTGNNKMYTRERIFRYPRDGILLYIYILLYFI